MSELSRKIEALLFIANSPVTERELKDALNVSVREIKNALLELQNILESEEHGIVLRSLAGGWVLETKPEFSELVGNFRETAKKKRIHLSNAAIETAAIIAYNQPSTRSEIDEIRGVHSDSPVAKLLELGLIKIAGRKKKAPGSPLLYMTTQKFLEVFGIDSLENLPTIDEIYDAESENKNEEENINENEENIN